MSVRQSLLAILDQGPCYGYQVRREFDRRTGAVWPLNVGQIYNTLERLERDGLVARGDADAHGHVYWSITDAGSEEVARWFTSPVVRAQAARDELAIKLTVAATLPGIDIDALLRVQHTASSAQVAALQARRPTDSEARSAEDVAATLVLDALIFHAEAEVRWVEHATRQLAQHPRHAFALELADERPKRGRPTSISRP